MTLDQWVDSTEALLALDAKGAIAPHGIGGHARALLEEALTRALSATRTETYHLCGHCEMGSYEGQVELVPPDFLRRSDGRGICVDVCLALEISRLWRAGIKTTGCCCGHGKPLAYIGVIPEHIGQMKEMGYEVSFNPSRPGDEDSFVPKTPLSTTEGE